MLIARSHLRIHPAHPPLTDPDTPAKLPAEEAALYECVRLEVSDVAAYVADGAFDWQDQPGLAEGNAKVGSQLARVGCYLSSWEVHRAKATFLSLCCNVVGVPVHRVPLKCSKQKQSVPFHLPLAGRAARPADPAAQPHRHEHRAAGKALGVQLTEC